MPVADFAGARNWGYDGVCLFAPSRNYGRPDDLRALRRRRARAGHRRHPRRRLQPPRARGRLPDAVLSGVPDRSHITRRGAAASTSMGRARTPCVASSSTTRCTGSREYHLDGLRLDATHALVDDRPDAHRRGARRRGHGRPHRGRSRFMPRTTATSRRSSTRRRTAAGGSTASGPTTSITSCDAAWPATGTATTGTTPDPSTSWRARCGRDGCSRDSTRRTASAPRGTDPSRLPMHRFVVCLQNHDQIGNRATGDRLNHTIDAAAWRAASTLLLTSPMTAAAVHGPGVGRVEPVPVLHRSRARARRARHRRTAARVRGLSGVHAIRRRACAFPIRRMRQRSSAASSIGASANGRRTRSRWRSTPSCCDCGTTHRALGASGRDVDRSGGHRRRHASPCGASDGGERFLVVVRLEGRRHLEHPHDEAAAPAAVLSSRQRSTLRERSALRSRSAPTAGRCSSPSAAPAQSY